MSRPIVVTADGEAIDRFVNEAASYELAAIEEGCDILKPWSQNG
jgi:hypothetical protein